MSDQPNENDQPEIIKPQIADWLRDQRWFLGRMIDDAMAWHPPNPDESEEYKAALNQRFPDPVDGEGPSMLGLEYARHRLAVVLDGEKVLDQKADRLAKFSMTAIGGVLLGFFNIEGVTPWLILPSISFFMAATIYANRAQKPLDRYVPGNSREIIANYKLTDRMEDWIAWSYEPVIVGTQLINAWVSRMIKTAHRLSTAGIALAVMGLLLPAFLDAPPTKTSKSPSSESHRYQFSVEAHHQSAGHAGPDQERQ